MTDFLILLLLTSLWTFGFRCLFQDGFLLERVGDWAWENLEFLSKPLFQCPPCMASIHGTYGYFMFFDHHSLPVIDTVGLCVAFVFCLCGMNYLLIQIFNIQTYRE